MARPASYVCDLASAKTATYKLQKLGGWKTSSMVERYPHVAPEALGSAAARPHALGGDVLGYVLATLADKGGQA